MENKSVITFSERRSNLSNMLDKYKSSFAQALPKILTPERMIRTALTALSRTPALMECTDISIISSLMTCAQLGLLPDSIIGEAYLIPFNNTKKNNKECTVIIGYKGLVKLAYQSGQVKSVQGRAVFSGDEFDYSLGLNEKIDHKPCGETDPSKITHFYAIIQMTTGGYVFNVMTRREVESIRDSSNNYKSSVKYGTERDSIWSKNFTEMGIKTVLRRLMKFVPMSAEAQRAIGLDEAGDYGKQANAIDHIDILGNMEYTEEAIAEVLQDEEMENEEEKRKKADELQNRSNKATQATLDNLDKK